MPTRHHPATIRLRLCLAAGLAICLAANLLSLAAAQQPVFEVDFSNQTGVPDSAQTSGQPAVRKFAPDAQALFLDGSSYLKFPGDRPELQFANGSRITLAAWVAPHTVTNGQQIYIVGKGRTQRKGYPAENQNYALRLRGINGQAKVSFLFRATSGEQQQYHRWNSQLGFTADGTWHHVAVQYEFGKPETIVAWVDGKRSGGSWDMGDPTANPPVVDDDQLWIGSSLGGSPNSTFSGWIRSVQIFRAGGENQHVGNEQMVRLSETRPPAFPVPELDDSQLADGRVLVEILEQVPERLPPFATVQPATESFPVNVLALDELPRKYVEPGVIGDRSPTFLVRCRVKKHLAAGDYEILVRAKSASALLIGNRIIGKLPMMKRNASGHEPVPKLTSYDDPARYPPPTGHQEKILTVQLEEGEHVVRWETLVGGNGLRNELGETVVAIRRSGESAFELLGNPDSPRYLTYDDWENVAEDYRQQMAKLERSRRNELAQRDAPYWNERHRIAKTLAAEQMPDLESFSLDHLINEKLKEQGQRAADRCSDEVFLRRVYLDTIGVPPSAERITEFVADRSPNKREQAIDRLLADPGYADHWVSYWQDVLAENPGILKPKLNNTGPFRFYIHESLLDNKPLDRFAAELIAMQGSTTGGGPAGFGQATQNDVPAAAKANVLSRAFLGIDLTCARCHDSPSSHFEQRDLFQMAAMLDRKPIVLPASSSVPGLGNFSAVKVTLPPGSRVTPAWPFDKDLNFVGHSTATDSRKQLAEIITSPHNERFAQVLANRIWTRIMGVSLVESPDDFLIGRRLHPRLLDYLGNYLRANSYDARQLVRMILNSEVYQRVSSEDSQQVESFAARPIKPLSAEQIVDSLFAISGKDLAIGTISFDPEGRRPASTFLNLGEPRRAWELTSLANERDRPALGLPRAQSIVDILNAFGWRESRPNPITERDDAPTLVQPLVLANGTAVHRVTQLSDDSVFTRYALESPDVETLVNRTYLQILGRPPAAEERQLGKSLLESGFANRVVPGAPPTPVYERQFRSAVSWSNHLHPDATRIKLEIEEAVRRGDFVTRRLQPDWRERMEDLVWALINSPEFMLIR